MGKTMKSKFLSYIAILPFISLSYAIFAEDVEEVVVTGSFIKGSPTDGASPVELYDRDTIEGIGAVDAADITANMVVDSGSENNADGIYGLFLGQKDLDIFNFKNDLLITFLSILAFIITILVFVLSIIFFLRSSNQLKKYQRFIHNFPLAIIALASLFNIIIFQFIFPSLDYLYPSKMISKKSNYIQPDAVVSSGYHEPSLVFLLEGNVLLSNPQDAALFLAEGKNNIALIEKRSLEDFLFSINHLNLKLEKADIVNGYNIAKGKHVEIHVYKNQMFDQSN